MQDQRFSLIITVINSGFVDLVMDAAKSVGAGGGTVLHGRGTGNEEIEKLFGITIQPEKELVLIVVNKTIVDDMLRVIYENAGLKTAGQGIAFSLPLDQVVGIGKATALPAAAEKLQEIIAEKAEAIEASEKTEATEETNKEPLE